MSRLYGGIHYRSDNVEGVALGERVGARAVARARLPGHRVLEFLSPCWLTSEQESLRIPAFAANLERAEILVPRTLRRVRFRFPPLLQAIEVFCGDLALAQPLEQVIAERSGQAGPLNLRHLFAERHPGQVFLKALLLLRVARIREAVGKFEESLPFLLPCFETGLDKFDNDSICAGAAGLCQRFHTTGHARGKADALAHLLVGVWHGTRIHRSAPACTALRPPLGERVGARALARAQLGKIAR